MLQQIQDSNLIETAREGLAVVSVQIMNVQVVSQVLISRNPHKDEASLLLHQAQKVFQKLQQILGSLNNNDRNLNLKQLIIVLDYARWNILVPFLAETYGILYKNGSCDSRILRPLLTRLKLIHEFLPLAISMPLDDLLSLDNDHPRWQMINKHARFKTLGMEWELKQQNEDAQQPLMVFNATISKLAKVKQPWLQKLIYELAPIYYLLSTKERTLEGNFFYADPPQAYIMTPMNVMEHGWRKKITSLVFPRIAFKRIIYVGHNFKPITAEFIQNQYKAGTINKITRYDNVMLQGLTPCPLKGLFTKTPHTIRVRVLAPARLNFSEPGNHSDLPERNVVLHIHGGGFATLSSRTYQTFTRQLANHLKCPVFSIDYGLSPEHVYPEQLNECWQVYLWLRFSSYQYLGFRPKKIILMGDSAGGNLVTALTILCIKMGVEVPDGAVMAYPWIALWKKFYTPSILLSLNDLLITHQKLQFFSECYSGHFDTEQDPLLSPLVISDELLERFPPTRLVVGTNDPLLDESWRFAQRMVGKDFRILVYPGMPHAFLSLDLVMGACKETIRDMIDLIGELFVKK